MSALRAKLKSRTKKRKLTTYDLLSIRCVALPDGTIIHSASSCIQLGGKSCAFPVTASKLEPKTSSEKQLGLKYDSEKPALAYIPKTALYEEGKAFVYGARKYEAWNYRNGIAVTRTLSAALRHVYQFLDGEDVDDESGATHLGSARANLAMAIDTLTNHPGLDDRFKGKK